MGWLNKLEKKFGRFAIPNLTIYIILTYVAGYILRYMDTYAGTSILQWLALDPAAIIHKFQIWRLFTWILSPPSSLSIFTVIMLFCYYQLGTLLERTWGTFRYNFYIFLGLIMTVAGTFIMYFIPATSWVITATGGQIISTYYVSLSIFLGFAMTFPEQRMLFMFVIPIKIKWLALVDIAYLVYVVVQNFRSGIMTLGFVCLVEILCSLAGTILFFFMNRSYRNGAFRQTKRQKEFRKAMSQGQAKRYGAAGQSGSRSGSQTGNSRSGGSRNVQNTQGARHKCAICGQTDLDNPDLEFRYCSRCNGDYEYCQNHLFTHEHVK